MTDSEWKDTAHFTPDEFNARDGSGNVIAGTGKAMDASFIQKLVQVREIVGKPLHIDSGIRTPEHNTAVGGVDSSAHLSGHAADIATPDSLLRFDVIQAACLVGFRRIGVGNTFVHLDNDVTKNQDVIWLYPPEAKRS